MASTPTLSERFDALHKARENVLWLLEHPNGLVDFKGLRHWAGRVEDLRTEIGALL